MLRLLIINTFVCRENCWLRSELCLMTFRQLTGSLTDCLPRCHLDHRPFSETKTATVFQDCTLQNLNTTCLGQNRLHCHTVLVHSPQEHGLLLRFLSVTVCRLQLDVRDTATCLDLGKSTTSMRSVNHRMLTISRSQGE